MHGLSCCLERKGKKVDEILETAKEVYTPRSVLAEIARNFLKEGNDENKVIEWIDIIAATSIIAQIDSTIALGAATCQNELVVKATSFKQNTLAYLTPSSCYC